MPQRSKKKESYYFTQTHLGRPLTCDPWRPSSPGDPCNPFEPCRMKQVQRCNISTRCDDKLSQLTTYLTSSSSISLETPSGPIQLIMRTAYRSATLPATFNSHFFSLDLSRCLPREEWNRKKIAQVNGKDLVGFWQRCHP